MFNIEKTSRHCQMLIYIKKTIYNRCGKKLRGNPQFLQESQFLNKISLGAWHVMDPQFNVKGTSGMKETMSYLKGQQ